MLKVHSHMNADSEFLEMLERVQNSAEEMWHLSHALNAIFLPLCCYFSAFSVLHSEFYTHMLMDLDKFIFES